MNPSTGTDARAAARLVLGGLVLLFAFTALYVTAFHAPHPRGLDVGFVGTRAQAAKAQRVLDAASDGAFDVRRYAGASAARAGLLDTDVSGVIVPGASRDRILVAQAIGVAPTESVTKALGGLAAASGSPTVVQDLRPLPSGDRRGLSSLFTVIGTLIPSLVFGALLTVFGRRLDVRARWGAVAAYAVLAGLVAAFDADVLVGALPGPFAGIAVVCGLLALAVAATTHGLGRLGGLPGIVLAVLLLLLLGVTASGGAVTDELEPGFYRAISQLLPPGAALTAVRNVAYFDWAATLGPLVVLGAWAAGGLAVGLLGERLGPHVRVAARASAARPGAPATAGSRA